MFKIITAAGKELILLKRDRAGLLVLFLMPALLVIVITLVQENVMELTGQKDTRLLLLDLDEGSIGRQLQERLKNEHIEIVPWDKQLKNRADVQAAVAGGKFQVGLIIPPDSSLKMAEATERLAQTKESQKEDNGVDSIGLDVFFDPGIMPGLRSGLNAQLQMAFRSIGMEAKVTMLEREISKIMYKSGIAQESLPAAGLGEIFEKSFFMLDENLGAKSGGEASPYNPVQQNVPAWALFGIFFTGIPLAGTILQERKSGIWIRLASLPISHLNLILGKIVAFVGVCLCQFLLVGVIGIYFFPFIGLPAFSIASNPSAVLLIILLSSLASCGFGIFLGMVCNTYEQASTLGYTLVVASAALGGVMVPVYAMPQAMQQVAMLSPLNWGLSAFLDILVRGASVSAIWDDLGRLVLFFLLTTLLAWQLVRVQR